MRYSKLQAWIYFICIVKIVFTILNLNVSHLSGITAGLSITVILLCGSLAYHENLAVISLLVLGVSMLLWLTFIVFSLFCARFISLKKASLVLGCLISLIDFVASLIISSTESKIIGCFVSIAVCLICVVDLIRMKSTR